MKAIFIGILALCFSLESFSMSGVKADISQVSDTIHIEFSGLNQWNYDLSKKESKGHSYVTIQVPRLSEPSLMNLKSQKSTQFEVVSVKHDGVDGLDVILLKISGQGLETFDYLTDQPSRLIIDIFKGKSEKKKETAIKNESNDQPKEKVVVNKDKDKPLEKNKRDIASDSLVLAKDGKIEAAIIPNQISIDKQSGIFDGGDPNFERFTMKDYEIKEDSILASKENYYINFPMLQMDNQQLENLNGNPPVYDISAKDTEENKQARLLQTLYNNKRYLVFLKTVDWFYKKFPNSEYDEIIRYMWADVYFSLWMEKRNVQDFELAMLRYRQCLEKYPDSPLSERTRMLMGFASLNRGDYLGTLRQFQNHISARPNSPNKDIAQLAIAEAFLKLSRFDEAIQTYNELEKNHLNKKSEIQANYYRGDVYYLKKDFDKAITEYKEALKKYPDSYIDFPSAYYNQASALFQLRKPRESLDTYLEFLKRFPNHSYAGYAMTRVGELMEILGADKSRVVGAYLETQFRYGDKPGSVVARLRLSTSRMNTMKEAEVEHSIKEILNQVKNSKLEKIDQFANVLIADGYASRKEYDKSIDLLIKYYQANPTNADTQMLRNRIVKYLNIKIDDLVEAGNFIDALKTHNKYADSWLKNTDRIDTKYNVGRAFEQAGAFKESEKLYKNSLNNILSLKGTTAEKERNVFEKLPTLDALYLRLAQTEVNLEKYSKAYEYIKQIKNPELLPEKNQIERVQLGAILLEKKGDLESATRYLVELIKTWKGEPSLVSSPYYQLAQIESKMGKKDDAIASLRKIDQLMDDSAGNISKELHAKAIEQIADILLEKGEKSQALKQYETLLDQYEKLRPLASIRYKVGKMYFEKGEIQKAADTWKPLKDYKNELWYKLAQEQLNNSEWNGDYKKYIKRIPAMSERK